MIGASGNPGGMQAARRRQARRRRWLRFLVGVAILGGFFWFLTTRPLPPGAAARLIERNLRQGEQATALFYADLERMPAIEERLAAAARGR